MDQLSHVGHQVVRVQIHHIPTHQRTGMGRSCLQQAFQPLGLGHAVVIEKGQQRGRRGRRSRVAVHRHTPVGQHQMPQHQLLGPGPHQAMVRWLGHIDQHHLVAVPFQRLGGQGVEAACQLPRAVEAQHQHRDQRRAQRLGR